MQGKRRNKGVPYRILMLAGAFFFANPVVGIVDILPDAVGAALIFFALTRLAFFDGEVERARKYFGILFAVECARLALTSSVVGSSISSNSLLAVTVFSVAEAFLYILIVRSLFSGAEYFALREGCMGYIARSDNTAFTTKLFLSVRLVMTFLPELLAVADLQVANAETDPDTVDLLLDIISAKPMIIAIAVLVSLVTGIVWYCSVVRTVNTFCRDTADIIPVRYRAEFAAVPEKYRPAVLARMVYSLCFALVFCADISFDNVRFLPLSAFFLLLLPISLAASYAGFGFRSTAKRAPAAWAVIALAEFYRRLRLPGDAVVINEIPLSRAAAASVIAIIAVAAALYAADAFLRDTDELAQMLFDRLAPLFSARICFGLAMLLWGIGYSNPYFLQYTAVMRFVFSALFIFFTAKALMLILETERENCRLYGKSKK